MGKGASHVDWAISMGIFLVYIMLTFIFIKPASEPEYGGNTLPDMVYSGLKNDTVDTIKKGYLIINPTDDITESKEYILRIRNLDTSGMDMDWVTQDPARHLTLVNKSLKDASCQNVTVVPFDFVDEAGGESRDCDDRVLGTLTGKDCVLEMKTYLESGEDNIFWFLYSDDIAYEPHPTVNTLGITDAKCVERLLGNKVRDCLLDDETGTPKDWTNFTYQFGVVESFSAVSKEKLDALKQEYENQYEALKGNWSFPKDKNFNITIQKIT